MYIEFLSVTGKNFLSIGATPLTLNLNTHAKSLIVGKNGNGKSIWLDLIIFALFGKAYRNINKSALINSINGKQCETSIEFIINNKKYKIIRNIKPEKFEIYIDGVLLTQDSASKDYQGFLESNILKMDYKSACQMMVIGATNYIPFLQLKSADRRAFVENILDLQLFTDLNKNLKLIIADEKSKYTTTQNSVNSYKNKIETYTDIIKDLELNNDKKKNEIDVQLKQKMIEYKASVASVDEIKTKFDAITYEDNSKEIQSIINENSSKIHSADSANTKLKSRIKFFDTTPQCLSCEQSIDPKHKQKHIDEAEKELNSNISIIKTSTSLKEVSSIQLEKLNKSITEKRNLGQQLKSGQDSSEWMKKDILRLGKEKQALGETDDSVLQNSKNELTSNITLRDKTEITLNESYSILQVYNIILNDLKDTRAKADIIKKYIPSINQTVNKYLDKFNLYLKFELDEQFSETLKSRHRDDFTFESFSNGEKLRINMSMLFGWMELSKLRAGVSTNLIFVDELLEICDELGVDEFLGIISEHPKTNLFLISHKDNLDVKFDRVLTMIKVKEFTQIT